MSSRIPSFTILDTRSSEDHPATGQQFWPGHGLRPQIIRNPDLKVGDVRIIGVYSIPDSNNNDVLIQMLKEEMDPINLYRNSAKFYRVSYDDHKNQAYVHTTEGLRCLTVPQGSTPAVPARLQSLGEFERIFCQNYYLREFLHAHSSRSLDEKRLFLRGVDRLLFDIPDQNAPPAVQERALHEIWNNVWDDKEPHDLQSNGLTCEEMVKAMFDGCSRFAIESIALRVANICRTSK